jgi:hypothetical protein
MVTTQIVNHAQRRPHARPRRAPEHRAGAGAAADMATLKALRGKGRVGPHPAAVMR